MSFIRHLALSTIVLFSFSLFAQDPSGCGTGPASEQQLGLIDRVNDGSLQVHYRAGLTYIPVKVHIVGNDDGTGYYRTQELYTAFCELNERFDPVDFYFYIDGDIHYINNSDYFNHDYSAGGSMMDENNVLGVVNMYFVGSPAGNCGYFSPSGDAVAIAKSCAQPGETTITHELGHFFGLPHTFSGWEDGAPPPNWQERADGSNCATRGDHFCDTPADYLAYRWTCPWQGLLLDPVGDTVHPDGTLYMSYSNDECTNRFSGMQIQVMKSTLILERGYLLGHTPAPYEDLDPVTLESPANGAQDLPADWVVFRWNRVPGATAYAVQASRFSSFSITALDAVVSDTFAVGTNFSEGLTYYWHVKPLMQTNTCEPYTPVWQFTAGAPTGIQSLEAGASITIFPNPVAKGLDVRIRLDQAARVRLMGLDGHIVLEADLETGEHRLQTAQLNAGVYFLEQAGKDAHRTQRIVVVE